MLNQIVIFTPDLQETMAYCGNDAELSKVVVCKDSSQAVIRAIKTGDAEAKKGTEVLFTNTRRPNPK